MEVETGAGFAGRLACLRASSFGRSADLEIGDTANLEVCATEVERADRKDSGNFHWALIIDHFSLIIERQAEGSRAIVVEERLALRAPALDRDKESVSLNRQ
ncbi:hypothetical protein SBV1_940011 [Verrucomicrobia bacterium]|nr:hypothetical protein SBV1_940011 [Verrucomicrobiota bacterium]